MKMLLYFICSTAIEDALRLVTCIARCSQTWHLHSQILSGSLPALPDLFPVLPVLLQVHPVVFSVFPITLLALPCNSLDVTRPDIFLQISKSSLSCTWRPLHPSSQHWDLTTCGQVASFYIWRWMLFTFKQTSRYNWLQYIKPTELHQGCRAPPQHDQSGPPTSQPDPIIFDKPCKKSTHSDQNTNIPQKHCGVALFSSPLAAWKFPCNTAFFSCLHLP